MCSVASAANETLRLANDLRRASRLSRSSLSLAAACCSSSVFKATFAPLNSSSGRLNADAPADAPTDFLDDCDRKGGISGSGEIVGLRIERGTLGGAARDYLGVRRALRICVGEMYSYRAPVAIPLPERIQPAWAYALAP